MKRLLLLLPLLASSAFGATCTNLVQDGFGNPLPVRVIVTPFTPTVSLGGTNYLGPSVAFNSNPTNGFWSVNLLGGFYLVQQGLSQPLIVIWATPGDTSTNSFASFASAATNPIPSFFYSGTGVMTNFVNSFLFVTNLAVYTNIQIFNDPLIAGNVYAAFDVNSNIIGTLNGLTMTNMASTNSVYYYGLWAGPTNPVVLNNDYQLYSTTTPTAITGLNGLNGNTFQWATIMISNSTANPITQYCTVGPMRYIGTQSTNALVVGAGKIGMWSFLSASQIMSNCVNAAQQ